MCMFWYQWINNQFSRKRKYSAKAIPIKIRNVFNPYFLFSSISFFFSYSSIIFFYFLLFLYFTVDADDDIYRYIISLSLYTFYFTNVSSLFSNSNTGYIITLFSDILIFSDLLILSDILIGSFIFSMELLSLIIIFEDEPLPKTYRSFIIDWSIKDGWWFFIKLTFFRSKLNSDYFFDPIFKWFWKNDY